ncbi:hypothetical protein [Bacillus sp. PS06]|uniref:hypothetical protein n=1 Tax=Bacillus sp. PS06 TaxID=2764176 RepID=UPI00177D4350|nr:hypothetical protein [Bacillus sp. PS06]MBD8069531.1 hypothetical protein [Bacillus sp. PS06]
MSQRIGNVGLLNIVNATPESIKGIESIGNVGMVLYSKDTAPLLSQLNIGNIGGSAEIPEGYSLLNSNITIDHSYLESISEPTFLFISGDVTFEKNLQGTALNKELQLIISGNVFVPAHLSGAVNIVIKNCLGNIITYENSLPRYENGAFTLTNSFLFSLNEPQWLVVNGLLKVEDSLDLELFEVKITKLEVNGKISLYQHQEASLHKKITSLTACKLEIIPNGYVVLNKSIRLNARSIRRFKNKKLYTKKPIMIEKDVTRELLSTTIASIHSTSVIICQEQLEDLIFEVSSLLETEVLAYDQQVIMIEGDEVWSNEQFLALTQPTNFIINGQMRLDEDVEETVLLESIATIDILGEVIVPHKKIKGSLQNLIRVCTGSINEATRTDGGSSLKNIGELCL